jgi:4-hydroxybenzoate polyprenyltransferase
MATTKAAEIAWHANLAGLWRTMRPWQWSKNVMVFAAVVFDGKLLQPELVLRTLVVFACFCVISSGVYIMNDLVDMEKDREHPVKRGRPLASGTLRPGVAIMGAAAMLLAGLTTAFWLNLWVGLICVIYLAQNVAYSFYLKQIVIIDVMVLALGFLLRVIAGGVAVDVQQFSPWLYVCVTLLALFLGFGKRRHELVLLEDNASNHRASLGQYNLVLLDQIMALVTTSTLITYTLYTFDAQTALVQDGRMLVTVPFVFYFIVRYLYLIHVRHLGGAPDELLFKDRPLLINSLLWMVSVVVLLYMRP